MTQAIVNVSNTEQVEKNLSKLFVAMLFWQPEKQPLLQRHITPHARTLCKAREQVKWMVKDGGFSPAHHQLLASMVSVVDENSSTLVIPGLAFMVLGSCWDEHVAAYAAQLLHQHDVNSVKSETLADDYLASSGLQVAI
ncbi:hypothetical protein [Legionella pneumophila]|uniref:Uncharacterized protein n=1 Tax=Legionella pneumophila subsp. pascullei TaxID=91890 RepID=A0AAX2IUR9_LEGPN|nr:hypothetical protein [Legionella pneumophila]AMP91738.1 hypothetical protein AXF36_03625 [Legionella pneumophila subsp. pascullei]SQG89550.1 Uncharacterised protein [Legionella pneumophila subsp. pascullei]VEH04933.1 Uncharacterised protein [Legionella pneumophila subsp. pascullei]